MTPKAFSLEEANMLVPALTLIFDRISPIRVKVALIKEALAYSTESKPDAQDSPEKLMERMSLLTTEMRKLVEEAQSYGCFVKDLENYLVDFYTVVDNKPIFLCWRYGEDSVKYWHDTENGYRGRQPLSIISQEVRRF